MQKAVPVSRPNAVITLSEGLRTPVVIGGGARIAFIAGPCQMESRQHALETAHQLKEIGERLNAGIIYKTSFDKANRTSASAARGIGLKEALPIFAEIREVTGLPTLTDVHSEAQCGPVGEVVDVLQIPAFLSRQTDLLLAARPPRARRSTSRRASFLAPWDMKKRHRQGRRRGQSERHGLRTRRQLRLQHLVSDMRALPVLRDIGCPVVFDATPQRPSSRGGQGTSSGGPARIRAGSGARRRLGGRGPRSSSRDPSPTPTTRRRMARTWWPLGQFEGPGRATDRLRTDLAIQLGAKAPGGAGGVNPLGRANV